MMDLDDDVTVVASSSNSATPCKTNQDWFMVFDQLNNRRKLDRSKNDGEIVLIDDDNHEEVSDQEVKYCYKNHPPFQEKYHFQKSGTTRSNHTFAKCDLCSKTMQYTGVKVLIHHINKCDTWKKDSDMKAQTITLLEDLIAEKTEVKKQKAKSKSNQTQIRKHPAINSAENNMFLQHFGKYIVNNNIPFRTVEDYYTKELFRFLNQNVKFSYHSVVDSINAMGISHRQKGIEEIKKEGPTLSIDGWTDVSKANIYAVMLQTQSRTALVKLIEVNGPHTSENIFQTIRPYVDDLFEHIFAVCTDSPSVMVKFRGMISDTHKHITPLPCCAHVVNLVAQDVASDYKMVNGKKVKYTIDPVAKCCKLVAYFLNSNHWLSILEEERKKLNISHKIRTFSKTRWYGLATLLKAVVAHRLCFLQVKILHSKNPKNHPDFAADIQQIVIDGDFWKQCTQLVEIFDIIADMISNLEKRETNLSHVLPEMIKGFVRIKKLDEENVYKNRALKCLSERVHSSFKDNIYIVAMFFDPNYRNCVLSKHDTEEIGQMFYDILKKWNFFTNQGIMNEVYAQFYGYLADKIDFVEGATEYWSKKSHLRLGEAVLRILSFTVHAAGVERLFSLLGLQKTKARNRMEISTLENMVSIKLNLTEELRQKGEVEKVIPGEGSTLNQIEGYNQMTADEEEGETPVNPEDFIEKLITGEEPSDVQDEITDMWMEKFFDIKQFEKANTDKENAKKEQQGATKVVQVGPPEDVYKFRRNKK